MGLYSGLDGVVVRREADGLFEVRVVQVSAKDTFLVTRASVDLALPRVETSALRRQTGLVHSSVGTGMYSSKISFNAGLARSLVT